MKRPRLRLRRSLALVVLASVLASSVAFADEKNAAKEAYERGAAEYKRGEYAKAATDFAAADMLAPSPAALKMALDAAVEADSVGLGLELIERSKRAPVEEPLASSVVAAKAKFDGRVVVVKEPPPAPPPEEPAPAPPAENRRVELPQWVFWSGVGATGLAGVLTTAFGLNAAGTHGDFQDAGCTNGTGNYFNCTNLKDDGEAAATRTNIMLVTTLVFGAATAAIGLLFTRWR